VQEVPGSIRSSDISLLDLHWPIRSSVACFCSPFFVLFSFDLLCLPCTPVRVPTPIPVPFPIPLTIPIPIPIPTVVAAPVVHHAEVIMNE
jgi:hypothetical protein